MARTHAACNTVHVAAHSISVYIMLDGRTTDSADADDVFYNNNNNNYNNYNNNNNNYNNINNISPFHVKYSH